jgi:tRNA (cmo5U34)-methyltransferase
MDALTDSTAIGLRLVPDDGSKHARLKGIWQRLNPGAPMILVDYCAARSAPGFQLQLDRYAAYAIASGVGPETVAIVRKSVEANSSIVVTERNEQLLAEARFKDSEVFYAAGTAWRGWVAYA